MGVPQCRSHLRRIVIGFDTFDKNEVTGNVPGSKRQDRLVRVRLIP